MELYNTLANLCVAIATQLHIVYTLYNSVAEYVVCIHS